MLVTIKIDKENKMRRTFHVNNLVSISESLKPNEIFINVGSESVVLTYDEFKDLMSLTYTVKFIEKQEEEF